MFAIASIGRRTLRKEKLEAMISGGEAQVYIARRLMGATRQGIRITAAEC